MTTPHSDLDDVCPVADITLPIVTPSHRHHSAVGLKPYCVVVACSDLRDAHPLGDITLPILIPSHSDHSTIGLKPHCVIVACCNLSDVHPIIDVALLEVAVPHGNHAAIRLDPHRVGPTCGDCGIVFGTEVSRYEVIVVHSDSSHAGVYVCNSVRIATPVDKMVTIFRVCYQTNQHPFVIYECRLTRHSDRATNCAADGEGKLAWRYLFKVSGNLAVIGHGDGGCSGAKTGYGSHITRPADEVVAVLGLSHQVNYSSGIIGKSPFSRGNNGTSFRAGDGKHVRFIVTADSSGNQGYHN